MEARTHIREPTVPRIKVRTRPADPAINAAAGCTHTSTANLSTEAALNQTATHTATTHPPYHRTHRHIHRHHNATYTTTEPPQTCHHKAIILLHTPQPYHTTILPRRHIASTAAPHEKQPQQSPLQETFTTRSKPYIHAPHFSCSSVLRLGVPVPAWGGGGEGE